MEFLTRTNFTMLGLAIGLIGMAISFWRANKYNDNFHLIDLVMEDGKVSVIRTAFLLVIFVSCWVIIHKQTTHELDNGTFTSWLTIVATPIIVAVVGKVVLQYKAMTTPPATVATDTVTS